MDIIIDFNQYPLDVQGVIAKLQNFEAQINKEKKVSRPFLSNIEKEEFIKNMKLFIDSEHVDFVTKMLTIERFAGNVPDVLDFVFNRNRNHQ